MELAAVIISVVAVLVTMFLSVQQTRLQRRVTGIEEERRREEIEDRKTKVSVVLTLRPLLDDLAAIQIQILNWTIMRSASTRRGSSTRTQSPPKLPSSSDRAPVIGPPLVRV
ncbi:MAG: hypothetical protein ACRDJ5_06175, partial [Actinomycetota bacterium]